MLLWCPSGNGITDRALCSLVHLYDFNIMHAMKGDLCTTPIFAQFWSLRGARRRGNLVDYQQVVRLLRFARNDNTGVMQSSRRVKPQIFPLDTVYRS